jgi:hypothetical protein
MASDWRRSAQWALPESSRGPEVTARLDLRKCWLRAASRNRRNPNPFPCLAVG